MDEFLDEIKGLINIRGARKCSSIRCQPDSEDSRRITTRKLMISSFYHVVDFRGKSHKTCQSKHSPHYGSPQNNIIP